MKNMHYRPCRGLKIEDITPRKAGNKPFLKVVLNSTEIDWCKINLVHFLDRTHDNESEKFHKDLFSDFPQAIYYKQSHIINTNGRDDFVIRNGQNANSTVGVILRDT